MIAFVTIEDPTGISDEIYGVSIAGEYRVSIPLSLPVGQRSTFAIRTCRENLDITEDDLFPATFSTTSNQESHEAT